MASGKINRYIGYEAHGSYTPTIVAGPGVTGFTFNNAEAIYIKFGKLLLLSVRFNITNLGSGTENLVIFLPTGIKTNSNVNSGKGGCGSCSRQYFYPMYNTGENYIYIVKEGGNPSLPSIGTGFISVFAIVVID